MSASGGMTPLDDSLPADTSLKSPARLASSVSRRCSAGFDGRELRGCDRSQRRREIPLFARNDGFGWCWNGGCGFAWLRLTGSCDEGAGGVAGGGKRLLAASSILF